MVNHIDYSDPVMRSQIRVTQRQNRSFVTGIRDGAAVGYKYFAFTGEAILALELRGVFSGTVTASHDPEGGKAIGELELGMKAPEWRMIMLPIAPKKGKKPLYLRFSGEGELDFQSFCFLAE